MEYDKISKGVNLAWIGIGVSFLVLTLIAAFDKSISRGSYYNSSFTNKDHDDFDHHDSDSDSDCNGNGAYYGQRVRTTSGDYVYYDGTQDVDRIAD